MAVVVDEYGGTLGIVTMEDLIESIMGSINDEYDEEDDEKEFEIRAVSATEYVIGGLALLKDVEEAVGCSFENDEDCDTIGGFVVSRLGMIPEDGEHPELSVGKVNIKVISVFERHIQELYITVSEDSEEEAATEKNGLDVD